MHDEKKKKNRKRDLRIKKNLNTEVRRLFKGRTINILKLGWECFDNNNSGIF